MRTATSAVVREQGGPFRLEQVELDGPRPDEVLVEVVAAGMCHTDLLVRDSRPGSLPAVLGHEGAGVVREVGSEVRGVAPGDPVVLSFPSCGVRTNVGEIALTRMPCLAHSVACWRVRASMAPLAAT